MGIAGKRIAVPWDVIVLDEAGRSISIDVDQEFINRLPPNEREF